MKARHHLFRISAALLLATAMTAPGALPSHESFDYPDGTSISGQTGGIGWTNIGWTTVTGNGTIATEDGTLTYPGIVSAGGKMRFTGVPLTGTTTTSYRGPTNAVSSGTHYFRCMAQNLNNSRRYFGLGLFSGATEKALLGQGSGYETWTLNHVDGITNGIFTNVLGSAVSTSVPSLLVLKVEFLPGNERVTFWVNPDLSQPETAATAVGGSSFTTDVDYVSITRIRVGSGGYSATFGNPADHFIDEIEISPISPFAPPGLSCTSAGSVVSLAWPGEYVGWTLQTNAAGLGEAPSWGDVENTSSITATNLPVDPADPVVFFRLRSP